MFDWPKYICSVQRMAYTIPHSITSWIIHSSSVSQADGFCINNDKYFTAYKPFFIHISMPEQLVQFEQTEIMATVFNYQSKRLSINIHFYHVDGLCSDAYQSLDKIRLKLNINANSSESFVFPIIPIEIGKFNITLKAITELGNDFLLKQLTVVAPGIVQHYSSSFKLDPSNGGKKDLLKENIEGTGFRLVNQIDPQGLYQNINIVLNRYEKNIVPNTVQYRLSFNNGQQLFQPIFKSSDELTNMIKQPKLNAESHAFELAYNLYTLKYLFQINQVGRKKFDERFALIFSD